MIRYDVVPTFRNSTIVEAALWCFGWAAVFAGVGYLMVAPAFGNGPGWATAMVVWLVSGNQLSDGARRASLAEIEGDE